MNPAEIVCHRAQSYHFGDRVTESDTTFIIASWLLTIKGVDKIVEPNNGNHRKENFMLNSTYRMEHSLSCVDYCRLKKWK